MNFVLVFQLIHCIYSSINISEGVIQDGLIPGNVVLSFDDGPSENTEMSQERPRLNIFVRLCIINYAFKTSTRWPSPPMRLPVLPFNNIFELHLRLG